MDRIVLASGSPRRRELLHQMGIDDFEVLAARGEETAPAGLTPAELVRHLALQKAREVAALRPEATVIGADTVVVLDGAVLGKPADAGDARRMLSALSGRAHQVYTGLAVLRGGRTISHAECTQVHFRALTAEEIDAYVATGEPMDKAGAYGIQGRACTLIRGIEGDYYNVVGLPVCALYEALGRLEAETERKEPLP
ncbi:MAG: septum formation inhibitor Maf [Oscillospiraceae bacterium]|nr:septum formation inhibitor Maf [Oscillospiraceae bacterium]